MDECIHLLDPRGCTQCLHGPDLQKKVKPRRPRREKPSNPAPVDLAEKYLQEYLSGARCLTCGELRTGAAFQCAHERAAILEKHIEEIEAFQAANPDRRGKLVSTAASAALSRATLRAGLRNAPSPIEGLSMGDVLGLVKRTVGDGRAMEWKSGLKPGDELPV